MSKRRPMEEHIRATLLDMLAEMPLDKVRVRSLVARASIGRSTFYLYFDSVEAVYAQFEEDFFANLDTYAPTQESLRGMDLLTGQELPDYIKDVERGLLFLREYGDAVLTLCEKRTELDFKDRLCDHLSRIVESRLAAEAAQLHVGDQTPSFVVRYVTKGWLSSVLRWLEDPEAVSPRELATMFHYLLKGAAITCQAMSAYADDRPDAVGGNMPAARAKK